MISVELLSHDGSDAAVVNTARVSFAGEGAWHDLPEEYKGDPNKLIKYLADHKHTTPFRHNSFSIRCKAPIFIARQLGKHQAGLSWNEVSRRYVDSRFEFFNPDTWRSRPEGSLKQGSGEKFVTEIQYMDEMTPIDGVMSTHIDNCMAVYDSMIEAGVAPEQARMVLPQNMVVEWVWTGNLMAFSHVYNLRIDGHAQVEAQEFAKELNKAIGDKMPVSWASLTGSVDK